MQTDVKRRNDTNREQEDDEKYRRMGKEAYLRGKGWETSQCSRRSRDRRTQKGHEERSKSLEAHTKSHKNKSRREESCRDRVSQTQK